MKTSKTKLVALFVAIITSVFCIAQDTKSVLYYSVQNVSTVWNSSTSQKTNSTEDIKKYLERDENSTSKKEDLFLIPTIKEFIKESTDFDEILKINRKVAKQNNGEDGSLIIIAINKFDVLLEYQFYLFDFKDSKSTRIGESSFFIDPKSVDYQNTIQIEVQKLFSNYHNTNRPPNARIRLDNELIPESDTKVFSRTSSDTIVLDGTSSEDDNTPKKLFGYKWKVSKLGKSNAFIPNFKYEVATQKLVISDTGTYVFDLIVSDGILESNNTRVTIRVVKAPIIKVYRNTSYFIQNSLSTASTKRKLGNIKDSIFINIENSLPDSRVNFFYLGSRNKEKHFYINNSQERNFYSIKIQEDAVKRDFEKREEADMPGILLDTSRLHPSKGYIKYALNKDVIPTTHDYGVQIQTGDIKSNIDTIRINYIEKSAVNFFFGFGYKSFTLKKDNDSTTAAALAPKFGFRGYITERLSTDFEISGYNYKSEENSSQIKKWIEPFTIKLNYDINPFQSSKLRSSEPFVYFTVFMSWGKTFMTFQENNITEERFYDNWVAGLKTRVQLLKNHPNAGNLYAEGEIGVGLACDDDYQNLESFNASFGLVYGFNN